MKMKLVKHSLTVLAAAATMVAAVSAHAADKKPNIPPPVIPDGASIMEQFKLAAAHMLKVLMSDPKLVTGA